MDQVAIASSKPPSWRSRLWTSAANAYDALIPNLDRRSIPRTVLQNDQILSRDRRPKAIATAQDLVRNFTTAAWAVRKHTDYIATVAFNGTSEDESLNSQVENFIRVWGSRQNCDVTRQYGLRQLIRLCEMRRTVDGDVAIMKIGGSSRDRGRLQLIEAYRVQDPREDASRQSSDPDLWVNGFQLNRNGSVRRYALHTKTLRGRLQFERFVPVQSMNWLAYKEGFQYRGASPLLSSLNAFQDVYEGTQHHLGKMKAAASVALAIYRDAVEDDIGQGRIKAYLDDNQDGENDSFYRQEFGPGVNKLELLPGDRAEWMNNSTPASETVQFMQWVLSQAVKSLDLPDTFLREQDGTFFSNKAAWNAYKRTARPKQQDLVEWLDDITRWRVGMAVADGDIVLPSGTSFNDISWEWIPLGYEWGNPEQEARGALTAIAGGLDNPERVAKEHGTDIKTNIDKTIKWMKYADEMSAASGVDFKLAVNPAFAAPEDEALAEFQQTEEPVRK